MRLPVALGLMLLTLQQGQKAELRLPTLDVVVSDRQGRSIDSLTAADFFVRDGDITLPIDSVDLVRADRLIVIVLDEFHVTAGPSADRARDALLDFARDDLGPRDGLVVVKPLDTLAGIRLTGDRSAALKAIETFAPRKGDFTAQTPFERNFIAGTPARIASARTQIVVSALHASLAELSRREPARKTLILLSEGFGSITTSRTEVGMPGLSTLTDAANRARVAVYPMSPVATPSRSGDSAASAGTDDAPAAAEHDALQALATGTGGRSTFDAADVGPALRRALADASAYYVLTLSDDPQARGGRFRDVTVSVRRAGSTLLGRPRFWVPSDEEEKPASSLSMPFSSFALRVPRRSSPLIRPWFGMSRGDAGATRVDFVWEPAPRVPGEQSAAPVPARIALSVTTMEGVPVFDGTVLPAQGAPSGAGRSPFRASFQAPAGRLLVRMAIEDAAARVVDRDARDLVVAGFSGAVSLGSAEILRARTAREWRELSQDPLALPVAARDFSRAERLLVRVPVFAGGARVAVSARLMSGFGAVMRDLAVTSVTSRAGVYQIDLPLSGLAAGRYGVEMRAVADAGDARATFDFRVTP